MAKQQTWLITGTSTGFGRIWATYALKNGDRVVGTARNLQDIADIQNEFPETFLGLQLEVTDRLACFKVVEKALDKFGQIDVLINNAGYGQFGYVEELEEEGVRRQLDVNVCGSIWMIQAVLPSMRAHQSGYIIQVSSIGGLVSYPGIGMYHASKWAVEGLCESLAQEVEHLGIKVTLIEPGGYATDFGPRSAVHSEVNSVYDPAREKRKIQAGPPSVGDPKATAPIVFELSRMEQPPLRLLMGEKPWKVLKPRIEERMKSWEEWLPTTLKAHGENQ
jgi:NADP-dependent 3-hydroxy acid dehydrogenase YdfG